METTTLTEGAIMKICRDEYPKGENWKPVLQILDVRMVNTQGGQPVAPEKERYRVVISDGAYHQQGMLGTQNNDLVRQGRLQKGSLVRLKEFVCTPVQARLIIIIVDLDLILETCDLIGEPEPAPKFVNTPPSGAVTGNPQSSVGNKPSGGQVNETVPATSVEQPRMNQSFGSAYSTNPNSGRYAAPGTPSIYPKIEPGAGFPRPAPVGGSYSNQNMGFNNPRSEVSRPPQNSHVRAPYPSYQQPPPMYSNRGPIAKNEAPARILPIAALNPYQGRWTIKARVTSKGELRHFNNPRGDGKVFSFDLLDSEGGEIRVTCFNAVADQFYNQIEVGKIYMISRGSLKPAQKAFNHLHNDHEIFLESTSIVQPCYEDDNSIPRQQFHFHPISDVQEMDNNSVVDLIGVVSFINPASSIMRKNGTETQKRSLHLKDMSGRSVELTLWGNFCNAEGQRLQNMCDSGVFPVLAVKSGRVNDFNGKAVGTISSSQLFINPDFPEAHRLKEWFDKEGRNAPSVSISREISTVGRTDMRKTISQIKDEKLGTSEKPDWITVGATISFIKVDNFCYTACPLMIGDRQCNKKVTNNGDGKWRCDRCDQSIEECDYRYILQLQIQDHTGLTWVTAFQEGGEEVMGVSAKSLYYLKHEEQDDEKFAQIVRKVLFNKFIFKLKIKEETFSDEQRVKSTVVKAERVNFSSESKFLLNLMDKLKAGNSSSSIPKVENIIPNPGLNTNAPGNFGTRQPTPADFGNSVNAVREFGTPANQVGQYGNRYSSSGCPSIGSSGMYLSCNSCGGTGHSSMNCPSIANSPGLSSGGGYGNRASSGPSFGNSSDECYKCHQTGHWARDCPGSSNIPPSYGSGSVVPGRYGGVPKQQVGGF
ncbi:replication protein A 70 kDa DNA-binding subunit A isoform X1 [Ziziphus jujuba]|uniref:Replication protein A subunit n=1 Tax=Ziziphus jujuba TaxID=326968 RepID=A0A6P4BEB7_ZIZJJ|nr:replication protein A 70 kDa DNA-binding subunit A isoform X1 [Ziziphus jujuba]